MRPFNRIDYSGRYRPYGKPRPPRWLRTLNRLLLLGFAAFLISLPLRCSCSETPPVLHEDTTELSGEDTTLDSELPDSSDMGSEEPSKGDSLTTANESPPAGKKPLTAADPLAKDSSSERDITHILTQRDTLLANRIDVALRRYRPDGALILMVDAASNEILAWGQRSDSAVQTRPTYLSRSTFPAASVIKIVTAATALESRRYVNNSELPQLGRNTTLYRNQLRIPENHTGATITVEDAFARSANPAMGMIGQHLGGRALHRMGLRLGFERHYPDALPQYSSFAPPDTGFPLAEAASGFTKSNTLSPLLAAAIVRSIATGNDLQIPWSTHLPKGYAPREPVKVPGTALSSSTYTGLRQMMARTATHGTASRALNKVLFAQTKQKVELGGKTGSLDGYDPKGRYDWFVGYARAKQDPSKAVVIIVMQYHQHLRSLPSSSVAGWLTNHWARHHLP